MTTTDVVWIVDDDHAIRWVLAKALSQANIESESFERGDLVLEALSSRTPAAIISDIRMPGISGLDLLTEIHQRHPQLPVPLSATFVCPASVVWTCSQKSISATHNCPSLS